MAGDSIENGSMNVLGNRVAICVLTAAGVQLLDKQQHHSTGNQHESQCSHSSADIVTASMTGELIANLLHLVIKVFNVPRTDSPLI
jgi:hypothetical protein